MNPARDKAKLATGRQIRGQAAIATGGRPMPDAESGE
jgi:hypothetical protein